MQSVLVVWRLLLTISTFVLPQLLGVLLYFRLTRFPRWLAHGLAFLTPAVLFFYLSPLFFFEGLREAQLSGKVTCGMPALGATVMVLFGTAAQVFVSLVVQLYLFRRATERK